MNTEKVKTVRENLQTVQEKIQTACERSGREPDEITIIGVTKYVSNERAKEAIQAGVIHLGENRDNEFLAKYNDIGHDAKWHFIGTLQSRKVRDDVNNVEDIISVVRILVMSQIVCTEEEPY